MYYDKTDAHVAFRSMNTIAPDGGSSPLMAGLTDGTPSLGRSNEGSVDFSSGPATPWDRSPFMAGETYSIPPPMDHILLPHRPATPTQPSLHAVLPNILDPDTAANVPIRRVCCIGAGYVGASSRVTRLPTTPRAASKC